MEERNFVGAGPAGEMLGTTRPMTGEGVGKALASGKLGSPTAAGRHLPPTFQPHWPTSVDGVPSPRRGPSCQNWLPHPWLAELLAWGTLHSPRLRHRVAGLLDETTAPEAVFTSAALLRSLWS